MWVKDEYFLDFISAEDIEEDNAIVVNERVVEQQIVQNISSWLLAASSVLLAISII